MSDEEKTLYVNFSAEINQSTAEALMSFVTQRYNQGINHFYFLFSSPGGNVANGVTIHNFLKNIPAKITMHNIGIVDSIANVIFLSGDNRFAVQNSSFLFHGVGIDVNKPTRFEEKDLKEKLTGIERDQALIAQIIAEHSTLSEEQIKEMFLEAATKTPDQVLESEIIQEVKSPNIPQKAEVMSLSFQRGQ